MLTLRKHLGDLSVQDFAFIVLLLSSCIGFVLTDEWVVLLVPALFLAVPAILLFRLKSALFLLFFIVPMSYEVYFSIGLGTDFPSEQLMWFLTGMGGLAFIKYWTRLNGDYVLNPITILLLAILAWIFFTAICSQSPIQSVKYFVAKIWYFVALFFAPLYLLKDGHDYKRLIKYLIAGTLLTVVVVFIRHLADGLSYDSINFNLWPFYRNHVSYACMIAVVLPFVIWHALQEKRKGKRTILLGVVFFLLISLYFSYTRAAILSVVLSIPFVFIVQWKIIKPAFFVTLLGVSFIFGKLIYDYNYLEFAPNYQTTIQHQDFEDVLSATYRLEDLSTMERFYRWIAGYNMIKERPILGYGPANFYDFYRPFTVKSFTTYVSDNKDQSGIHNYYLMLWVEQGVLGLILFLSLVYATFGIGQKLYHSNLSKADKQLVLAAMSSIFIILSVSFMNDMIETDKVGALFFLSLAIITKYYCNHKLNSNNPTSG